MQDIGIFKKEIYQARLLRYGKEIGVFAKVEKIMPSDKVVDMPKLQFFSEIITKDTP